MSGCPRTEAAGCPMFRRRGAAAMAQPVCPTVKSNGICRFNTRISPQHGRLRLPAPRRPPPQRFPDSSGHGRVARIPAFVSGTLLN